LGLDLAVLRMGSGLSAIAAFDDARTVALLGVNVDEPFVRQRFSLAHGLAHVLFDDGHPYDETDSGERRPPAEVRADKFAQTFLLPAEGIEQWVVRRGCQDGARLSFDDGCRLADDYLVSPQTAWVALGDLRRAPEQPAPSARDAAIVAGRLASFGQREAAAKVQRIPHRVEERVLGAF
jgi:hypothetical protein